MHMKTQLKKARDSHVYSLYCLPCMVFLVLILNTCEEARRGTWLPKKKKSSCYLLKAFSQEEAGKWIAAVKREAAFPGLSAGKTRFVGERRVGKYALLKIS